MSACRRPLQQHKRGARLVAALYELDGTLPPGRAVQRQLHKAEGATVQVLDLQVYQNWCGSTNTRNRHHPSLIKP